jgi:hypothetical protein
MRSLMPLNSLGFNNLGPQGATKLAEALTMNSTITKI